MTADKLSSEYYLPAGATADGTCTVSITPESAGWRESSLWVIELAADEGISLESEADEIIVVPLRGAASVSSGRQRYMLRGRKSVFDGPTDFAYVGIDSEFSIDTELGGRFALLGARANRALPFRYIPAEDVAVELRGSGSCSRQVHNFATPETFDADALIACEVITPGGNWSSYPPHKHDETSADEAELEEIYYFEIADSATGTPGFGYHRVYGTDARPIDVTAEVRTGDTVLVPHGYHGPSIAAPGYDMYYLNVMAGPGPDRAWKITDDPAHAWIRETWPDTPVDARLPLPRRPRLEKS
ncbi:5-deoxy-glucuronate isomerase [Antrihabitans sp. YC2-6]|uniref:5-deoxy-glucuronate isomerase n=1 Tax=Antrihabitans sp. YC2-6 TaxID=2799498 RepID=UPI0018F2BEF3|nr:5-deoxy-glucuronate isomerase [Antrihabitans sp. YC2-6]MBJ8343489.1 5-deoxy-glucuronate isomerase [Antrihabitans sp. YC2-6]